MVVEELHAELLAGLDGRVDAERLVLADQVGDGGGDHQELITGDAAGLVHAGAQHLADDRQERRGELHAHLLLLVGREGVNDSVDGAGGARGVQGAEHQVAGLCGADGGLDGLEVTHFADEDHVRVLSQRALQRLGERGDVDAQLALVDHRLLVVVVVLDRVLHRDDVAFPVVVDVVDHRRERRRLSRASGAGDDEETTRTADQVLADLREADLLEGEQAVGDLAQHHADDALLLEDRDTEAGRGAEGEAEVGAPLLLQLLLVLLRGHALHELHHVLRLQRLGRQVAEAAAQADGRGTAAGEVKVGGVLLDDDVEQAVHLQRGLAGFDGGL